MHEGRAGVARIVEADLVNSVLLEKLRKGILDVSGLETVAELVREHVLSSVSNISSSAVKQIVALSLLKSIEFIKAADIYFQKTLFFPLTSGSKTTKRIPGSNVTFIAIKAGNAKLRNEYFMIPSFSAKL